MSVPITDIQTQPESSNPHGVVFPPGDLYSDEPALESYLHLQQLILLLNCLDWLWRDRTKRPGGGPWRAGRRARAA